MENIQGPTSTKRLVVDLPEQTHRDLKARAAKDGQTVTYVVTGLIQSYLSLTPKVSTEPGVKMAEEPGIKAKPLPPAKGRRMSRQKDVDDILRKAAKG